MDFKDTTMGMEPEETSVDHGITPQEQGFAQQETVEEKNAEPAGFAPYTEFPPPRKPDSDKGDSAPGKTRKRVLWAALAVAVLVTGCLITAGAVNARWEKQAAELESRLNSEMERMNNAINNKLDALQQQLGSGYVGSQGVGSELPAGNMDPGTVYAQNVDSVVLISNELTTSIFGQSTTGTSTGSGFILTEDGYVVTNHHVIEGGGKLSVLTNDGTRYSAELIGSDETNDVALLKIEASGLQAVKLGSSAGLSVGEQVAAIGNPLGDLTSTLTVGYVSAKERDVSTEDTVISMIQTDAAINSGNSGGPLFNMRGEVIGITTAKFSGTTSSGASIEGIGFAIPIDDVQEILADLQAYGYVKSAYLGIMVRNMNTTEIAAAELYDFPIGVYVDSVEPGYCAAAAGLQSKDIIIELGGYEIETRNDLARALRRLDAGQTTTITVFRSAKEVTMTITLDEKPRESQQEPTVPEFPGQMPDDGSFEEWYDYFFGKGND